MSRAVRRSLFHFFVASALTLSSAQAKLSISKAAAPVFAENYETQGNPLKQWRADQISPWATLNFGDELRGWLDLEAVQSLELDSARLLALLMACAKSDPAEARKIYLHSLSNCRSEPTLQKEMASLHVRFDQFLESSAVYNILADSEMTLSRFRTVGLPRINPLFQQIILESLAEYGFYRTLDVDYNRSQLERLPQTAVGKQAKTGFRWTGRFVLGFVDTVNPVNIWAPGEQGTGALTEGFDKALNQSAKAKHEATQTFRSVRIARLLLLTILLTPVDSKENWGFWPAATESIFYGLDGTVAVWGGGHDGAYNQGSPGSICSEADKRAVKTPIQVSTLSKFPHWTHASEVVSALRSLSRAYHAVR
jgi:hypothetical protein